MVPLKTPLCNVSVLGSFVAVAVENEGASRFGHGTLIVARQNDGENTNSSFPSYDCVAVVVVSWKHGSTLIDRGLVHGPAQSGAEDSDEMDWSHPQEPAKGVAGETAWVDLEGHVIGLDDMVNAPLTENEALAPPAPHVDAWLRSVRCVTVEDVDSSRRSPRVCSLRKRFPREDG